VLAVFTATTAAVATIEAEGAASKAAEAQVKRRVATQIARIHVQAACY
jgi:hypothetical protein